MGDMVCTTPLFRAVKKHIPNVRLIVLGNAINESLLFGSSDVDRYVVYDEKKLRSVIEKLHSEKIDVAILSVPNPRGLATLALSRARIIIAPVVVGGWSPYETKAYKILRLFVKTAEHCMGSYAPREYLKLLEPLKIKESDTQKHLAVQVSAKNKAVNFLKKLQDARPLVIVAPSVGNKIRRWPGERFARVINHLRNKYDATVLIVGGSQDVLEVNEVLAHLQSDEKIMNLSGMLSLEELKAYISECDMFISVDSGPLYIAEALHIPTVDIVGPVDPKEHPPQGGLSRLVLPPKPYTPAIHILNTSWIDIEEAKRQTDVITVEAVVSAIDNLFATMTFKETKKLK